MRKKILRIAVCLAIVLAFPVSLLISAFALPAQYGESYLAGLSVKWDRLRETEGRKIVVAGGSGSAFALRSDLLEEELPDYETVNFGLYAGLGTTVMLDLCLNELREGDILIFEPELSEQTLSTFFSGEAMWQASEGRGEIRRALPLRAYGEAMVGALPQYAAEKTRFFLQGNAPSGSGIYSRDSFDAYGDLTGAGREKNTMPGGFDLNMPLCFDPDMPGDAFIEKVRSVSELCAKKGVRFYFRFCPMNAAALSEAERARMPAFEANLQERLGCAFLGSVSDAVMEAGWFFDTNFHLNASGAVAATSLLARDLKAELGDDTPVKTVWPEMPDMEDAAHTSGDDRDEACFLYEKINGGYVISTLSETGKGRESLTVPAEHEGLPVMYFEKTVFSGNQDLRELTVQENVQMIPDSSFEGCTAFERLIVLNPKPENCSVGSGLLDGTGARIFVPRENYGAYCTNYFWAQYAARIEPLGEAPGEDHTEEVETEPAPGRNEILYHANGGQLKNGSGETVRRILDNSHLRVNTLQGASYFEREGYVLRAWNTEVDGSGTRIGLGSRIERLGGQTLYAEWVKASPEEEFVFETADGGCRITGWYGSSTSCVIPEKMAGVPVRSISAGSFRNVTLEKLVLPSGLRSIEASAFNSCRIEEITLFDGLREVSEESFSGCEGLRTIHINAALSPVYSGSYYDTFSDKYDWLLSIRGRQKIVLASGSSGRYGYDSEMLRRAFPDYEVANMGVYAWSNMRPQLELIRGLMKEGDILISAPEFDAIEAQFCVTSRLDAHFWAMMESNYDMAAGLDLQQYSDVWDSFVAYQRIRSGMAGKSYSISPANYDDDGNYYAFSTYNVYGDFILPRPNGDQDVRLRQNIADYTVSSFPKEIVDSLNAVYALFLEEGIRVYFSYTPRNHSSLTEQSTVEARAELHRYLCESISVPVISEMEDYLLSGVYFWLIDSHTSTEGAAIRTERLIRDLRQAEERRPGE